MALTDPEEEGGQDPTHGLKNTLSIIFLEKKPFSTNVTCDCVR